MRARSFSGLASLATLLLLLLVAAASSADAASPPVAITVTPRSSSNKTAAAAASSSRAYAAALSTLNAVVDAYSTKLATEKAALETAKLNHDAKAGLRVLATGKAADVAAAKARAQAVVGAALANAIGQKCPNGSYPLPFKQRLAAVRASNRAAKTALETAIRNKKEEVEGKIPPVTIRIGNEKTSQASAAVAQAAAGVVGAEAAALNATSPYWGPALTSLFNGIGSLGNAKIAAKNATRNALPGLPGRRRSLSASDDVDDEPGEETSSLFDAFDLDALEATTDDVDGLLDDAAAAYAESLLVALPWGGPRNLTASAARAARAAKNATRNAIVAAGASLPPPINSTLAAIETLSADTKAKLVALKQRADAKLDAATSEDTKEAVVRDVRTRVWAVVQALDPRMTANVTTGTGCVVPPGSYVRNTVVDGYVVEECPVNSWCPGGPLVEVPEAKPCPSGTTTLGAEGAGSISNCVIPPGSYLDPFGQVKVCERDFWCPGGPYDKAPGRTPCGAGNTTLGATGSTSAAACQTIDPCLAPGTCCQGTSVLSGWSAATPACSQQAVPSPVCVNLNVDTRNCGSCGNACPGGSTCTNGECTIPPGSYVDVTDPDAPVIATCPAEFYCPGGTQLTPIPCPSGTGTLGSPGASSADQCVPQDPCIPDPNTCCRGPSTQPGWPQYGPYFCAGAGGLCTNTAVDKNNCGSCGASCASGLTVACCSGSCVDLHTSNDNCAACGARCLGGSTCQDAVCTCPPGTTFSADGKSCLVPPGKTISPDGTVITCPSDAWCPGGVYCTSGCAPANPCPSGYTTYGATGQSSSAACGPIDPCNSPNTCCQGSSVYPPWSPSTPACAGLTSPNPTCNNLAIDLKNCGSCGAACPASTPNSNIACCSGVCKDLRSDINNCGSCGNVCNGLRCEDAKCITCVPSSYIYGISDNRVIFETDVNAKTNRGVLDADPYIAPGQPNAFAYDRAKDDFFFLDAAKTLWYWDRVSPTLTALATAAQMGISGLTLPANAVYWNNAYWFIKEGGPAVTQQTLYEIAFTYNGNQNPVYSATKIYTFNIVNSNNQPTAVAPGFGDIAVNNVGMMYLATSGGVFYRFNMISLPQNPGLANSNAVVIKTGNPSLQLSFSCDFTVLWAQNYNNNQWSTIDVATGLPTFRFTLPIPGQTNGLRDLGGAACTCAASGG